jgi:hypothetical protein
MYGTLVSEPEVVQGRVAETKHARLTRVGPFPPSEDGGLWSADA